MKTFKEIVLGEKEELSDDELDKMLKYAIKKINSYESDIMNKLLGAKPKSIPATYLNKFLPQKLSGEDLNYIINGLSGTFIWIKTNYFIEDK